MRGEFVQQPAVDGSERQLAALRACARAFDMIEQPGEFGCRKIRIEQQAGARGDLGFESRGAQGFAGCGGAPILPDDGGSHGRAGRALPQHGGLALVGDADCRDVARVRPGGAQRIDHRGALRIPDLLRVVFDPAGLRKVLREFALRLGHDAAPLIEDQRARTGGARIERENESRGSHRASLSR